MADINTLQNVHINHLITLKLTETNYILWKTLFKPVLRGYKLIGFVDGTTPFPPRTLPNSEAVNPGYTKHEDIDQLLLGCLVSSLTESVIGKVTGLDTSKAVRDTLEKEFSPKTAAHRRQLHNLSKDNLTMQQYFNHAKTLSDGLAACRYTVSNDDMKSVNKLIIKIFK